MQLVCRKSVQLVTENNCRFLPRYENVATPMWLRSKEGLLPFVELDGVEYHDSAFIMAALLKLCGKEGTEVRARESRL